MADIHLNSSGNPHLNLGNSNGNSGNVALSDSTMPRYIGARAVVTRVQNGIRIWMKDYKGETTETIVEAIQDVITNPNGSLTFVLPDGRELTTESLTGPQGPTGAQGPQGEPGTFWATYNTTTSAEIEEAYQNGLLVCVKLFVADDLSTFYEANFVLTYRGSATYHKFSSLSTGITSRYITVNNDVWSSNVNTLVPVTRKINGKNLSSDISLTTSDLTNDSGFITSPNVVYCTCDTAASEGEKIATIVSGSLASLNTGDQALVKFTNSNTISGPSLKIGLTDAVAIKRYGTTAPGTSAVTSWNAGNVIMFVYDGTYWQMADWTTTNTTYSAMTEAEYIAASSTSAKLISPQRLRNAILYWSTGEANVQSDWDQTDNTADDFIKNKPTIPTVPTNVSAFTNDAGYLTSFTETDPVFLASAAHGISSSDISNWNGKYTKASTGIPKTDLESAVQTSLGKADTALQSFTETDPTVPSWAKASSKPSYTAAEVGAVPTTRTINGQALSSDVTIPAFTGSTNSSAGSQGLVPAPSASYLDRVLTAQGDWRRLAIFDSNGTRISTDSEYGVISDSPRRFGPGINFASANSNGLMSSADKTKLDGLPNIHISTADPTSADGEDGDIWIKYTAPSA